MITSKEMQELELYAETKGVSTLDLMEHAGQQVYATIKEKYDITNNPNKHVVVFAGPGNNGGDGFVAARYFLDDCPVLVLFFGKEKRLPDEALENYEKIKKKIAIVGIQTKEDLAQFKFNKENELILIDALLGTGIQGKIREPISFAIDLFNKTPGDKIALDIPSGMNPDTGDIDDKSCNCDIVISLHDIKAGLVKSGQEKKTIVVDIGIPGKQ